MKQLGKKQKTDFQNKMIHVVYQLLNSLGVNKEFEPLFSEKKSEQTEEKPNKMQKPSRVNISENNYNSLIQDVVNNLGNKNHHTTVNN